MLQLGKRWKGFIRARGWVVLCCALGAATGPAQAFLRAAPEVAPPVSDASSASGAASPIAPETEPHPQNPFYDRTNPDFGRLQAPRDALEGLPRDADDKVDWMKALRGRAITPRASVDGTRTNFVLDLDVIMRNTKAMPYVRFPHLAHTEWLDCSNCHPSPFEARAGSTQIKMENIFRGQFCGACHDRVAFITHRNCFRCHSVPQPGSPMP